MPSAPCGGGVSYAENSTLANVRASVIATDTIPDTYLIEPTGAYWESKNATIIYEALEAWLLTKSEAVPSERFQNQVNRALFNTATLLEGRIAGPHHVTALVVAKERALGTYDAGMAGYLKKYHDYVVGKYDIPNTAGGIDAALNRALGDMAPLANEIVSVTNRAASIGGVPNELLESDIEYWVDVELSTYCGLDGGIWNAHCTYPERISEGATPSGTGNQTSSASASTTGAASGSASAAWYWRALACISYYEHSYGAVCSGTPSGSSIPATTASGTGIYSRLTVTSAQSDTKSSLKISVSVGDKDSGTIHMFGTGQLKGTWYGWPNITDHPCHVAGTPYPFCMAAETWTFSGSYSFTAPDPPQRPPNLPPEHTVTNPTHTIWRYIGHIDTEEGGIKKPRYGFVGTDSYHNGLTLVVLAPPTAGHARLVSCEVSTSSGRLTLYDSMNDVIATNTYSPIRGSMCLDRPDGVGDGAFKIRLLDNRGKWIDRTVDYHIDDLFEPPSTQLIDEVFKVLEETFGDKSNEADQKKNVKQKKVKVDVKVKLAAPETVGEVVGILTYALIEVWRCNETVNICYDSPDSIDEIEAESTEQTTGWVLISTTQLMPDTDSDNAPRTSTSGYTATTRSAKTTSTNFTGSISATVYDSNIEPGHTYKYVARALLNGSASDYIPLGNITLPADTTPPVIVLSEPANMTLQFGLPYVEPGYQAFDDYDKDITGNVTVTGAVNATILGTYTIQYDVTDSSGNAAITQNRTVTVTPDFITTWRTTTPNESITIPVGGATGTYHIDWGDGTTSLNVTGSQTHTYATPGNHTVGISGDFSRIQLGGDQTNAAKLVSIDKWGGIMWATMNGAFAGASNMIYNAADSPDLSRVTDMSGMFRNATSFNGAISSWDVTSVTDMSGMFDGASSFRQNLGPWYVAPDDTTIRYRDTPGTVGTMSAQNTFLDGQSPAYDIGTGGDSALFSINGTALVMKVTPDRPIQNPYIINITAGGTGLFGDNNHHIIPIHVELPPSVPPAVSAGPDLVVTEGGTVTINGTASDIDPEDTMTVQWTQHPAHPVIPLHDITSPTTSFTAPLVLQNTTITLTLTATDSRNTAASDNMTVTISDTPLPPGAFVTTWRTVSPNESIIIPVGGAAGAYNIDWGDGTISFNVTGDQTHTYASPGWHTVTISGDFTRIKLGDNTANALKLVSIDQWGDMQWSSMQLAFKNARNMVYRAADAPDLSRVTDMSQMFASANSFNSNISSWDVSRVTDMSRMFAHTVSFNGDISSWNVSRVTDMSTMFYNTPSFNQNISSWDVSRVTDMSWMFAQTASFNQNLPSWNVSRVTDMRAMFYNAYDFNGDISNWNVSQVTDMSTMFDGASSFRQNLGAWYVIPDNTIIEKDDAPGTVGHISAQNTFLDGQSPTYGIGTGGDSALFSIAGSRLMLDAIPANRTHTVNVTSTGTFGTNNHHILEINILGYVNRPPTANAGPDQTIPEGSTVRLAGSATDPDRDDILSYLWTHDSTLNITLANATSISTTFVAPQLNSDHTLTLTLTVTDQHNATASDSMNVTIQDVPDPDSYFVTTWRTVSPNESITIPVGGSTSAYHIDWGDGTKSSNVIGSQTHTYASPGDHIIKIYGNFSRIHLGGDESNARKLISIDQWGNIQWITMREAFAGATNMAYLATDSPDLSSITDMSEMFTYASSFNGNISHWDVSRVTDMSGMFTGASSFNGNISHWDVSRVTNMKSMFTGASSFNQNLSSWDVSQITDMSTMFSGARAFNGNISGWDVASVTDMHLMFSGARAFNGDISSWNVSQVTSMIWMFNGASSFRQNLGAWYVVPDSTTIEKDDAPGVVGHISAQNTFLDGQSTTYGIGTGGDSASFNITGSNLVLDVIPTKQAYAVNVTSAGGFGTNNHQILEIHVYDTNEPPTANAGPEQTIQEGSIVHLAGNATDPDGDILSYLWTHDSALNITLADATSLSTTFVAPAVHANTTITFTLTVSDTAANTTDSVYITITPAAAPPAAPQNLRSNTTISTIMLTWDDPDDDTITGYKILYRIPATQPNLIVSVNDTGSAHTTHTIPNLEPDTTYAFRIIAINEHGESERSEPVTVSTLPNNPPIADAGPNQTVRPGDTITLNGTASYDPDDHTISYAWNQTSGPATTISGNSTASPTFAAPAVTEDTTLTFQLTVSDGWLTSNDSVDITIMLDRPPVITLYGSTNMTIQVGSTYTEPGYAATDNIDGDITANVTVTGTVDTSTIGTYTIRYDVTDSSGNAAAQQTRTIHVVDTTPPVITLRGGTTVLMPFNYTYVESGYTATDNYDGNITANVIVTGTVNTSTAGTYTIRYDVKDSSGNAAVQQVRTVHVSPPPPPTDPTNLQASNITGTSVTLSWDASTGHVTGYKILYRLSAPGSQLETLVSNTDNTDTSYMVSNLKPDTAYAFRVIAIGLGGESQMSNFVRMNTDAPQSTPLPTAPANLQASNITAASVVLSWDDPADTSITGYKIVYRIPSPGSQLETLVSNTGSADTSYMVSSLEPNTAYVFRVISIGSGGESQMSNFVRIDTPGS